VLTVEPQSREARLWLVNIKIHVEQPTPPGVYRQRSDERDEQTDKQTNKQTKNSTFLATPAAGEIRAPPNLAR